MMGPPLHLLLNHHNQMNATLQPISLSSGDKITTEVDTNQEEVRVVIHVTCTAADHGLGSQVQQVT